VFAFRGRRRRKRESAGDLANFATVTRITRICRGSDAALSSFLEDGVTKIVVARVDLNESDTGRRGVRARCSRVVRRKWVNRGLIRVERSLSRQARLGLQPSRFISTVQSV